MFGEKIRLLEKRPPEDFCKLGSAIQKTLRWKYRVEKLPDCIRSRAGTDPSSSGAVAEDCRALKVEDQTSQMHPKSAIFVLVHFLNRQ